MKKESQGCLIENVLVMIRQPQTMTEVTDNTECNGLLRNHMPERKYAFLQRQRKKVSGNTNLAFFPSGILTDIPPSIENCRT